MTLITVGNVAMQLELTDIEMVRAQGQTFRLVNGFLPVRFSPQHSRHAVDSCSYCSTWIYSLE